MPDYAEYDKRACELALAPYKRRLAELRFNPYHDPTNGRFTSGGFSKKGLTGKQSSGITKEKTKYASSPRANSGGITISLKTFAKVRGEFNTRYPSAEKGTVGNISKGIYQYNVTADGDGGIIINYKFKLK